MITQVETEKGVKVGFAGVGGADQRRDAVVMEHEQKMLQSAIDSLADFHFTSRCSRNFFQILTQMQAYVVHGASVVNRHEYVEKCTEFFTSRSKPPVKAARVLRSPVKMHRCRLELPVSILRRNFPHK